MTARGKPFETWAEVAAFALSLPGTEDLTSYGKPAVKAGGKAFLFPSREPDSFGVMSPHGEKAMLMETEPDTFWETAHYSGYPAVLVRYGSPSRERIELVIQRAWWDRLPRLQRTDFGPVPDFACCVAIDWSGAKGRRHKGIAIAEARGTDPPRLVRPGHVWSRQEVLDWLLKRAAKEPTLFGFDFSFAPPFMERGAYLPGEPGIPDNARDFWAYVDSKSQDDDLGAASFLEEIHRRHFYFGIADGVKADFVRFRICDAHLNAQGGRKTASAYDAIGAAQVAKASFSGMRLLHRLDGKVAIWPMNPLPDQGSAVIEIYTRIYLRNAGMSGKKLRSRADLNRALAGLGSKPVRLRFEPDDHQTDALVTAAGMRAHLQHPSAFSPPGLTPELARTEGWTFGIV